MKNVLITGGAGFIGSNFIRFLQRERPELTLYNLDSLTYAGNLDNLANLQNQESYAALLRHGLRLWRERRRIRAGARITPAVFRHLLRSHFISSRRVAAL